MAASGKDGSDRTVIIPSPGGSRGAVPPAAPSPAPPPSPPGYQPPGSTAQAAPPLGPVPPAADLKSLMATDTRNPLIGAAGELLALVRQLSRSVSGPDPERLRRDIVESVHRFQAQAKAAGVGDYQIWAASYALCALVDETVLRTPWGAPSGWGQQTVLSLVHNETTGGERVFQILNEMLANPGAHLDALELYYLCISLGFMGRFGAMDRGRDQLDRIEQGLFQTIRAQRGDPEPELSPDWRGLQDKRPRVARLVPLWVVWAAAAAAMTLIFVGFSISLNRSSDDAFQKLASLGRDVAPGPAAPAEAAAPARALVSSSAPTAADIERRIRQALASDLSAGRASLARSGASVTLTLPGTDLFASGSATLTGQAKQLVTRVGQAVGDLPGPIIVAGYTDNQPIRTLKFPSNWHLSAARAEAVVKLMAPYATPADKLLAEGRADRDPIADNVTAAGRAQNRRIEIKLTAY